MMRRSRISVRPNVKPAGRALTASRDASAETVQPPQGPADSTPSEGSEVTAERLKTDTPVLALEQTNEGASQSSIPSDQLEDTRHGDRDASSKRSDAQDSTSTSVTSGPQRRKRFTALPNLAKPRAPPASSRTPKSPTKSQVKPVPPIEPETSTPAAASSLPIPEPFHNPKVPGRRRPSGGNRQAKTQPVPTTSLENDQETMVRTGSGLKENVMPLTVQQGESPDETVLVDENASEDLGPPAVEDIVVQQEGDSGPTVGEKQTDLLRERLQKLQSSSKMISSLKKVNDPADMVRLAQARKLRELLKKEMKKDKEDKKKPKMGIKERKAPKDHAKMTMRELIYYLPVSNPMKSFTEEEQKTSEIVLDDSPTPTSSKTPAPPSVQETAPEDAGHEEDEEGIEETQEEEPLLVPRVKVAEDGSLIIDEESLTVQVLRAKGPNPADDRDPIFERGSTTTYSSFRKGSYTKPWSNGETEMFFLAISMVGTDFSMIGQLFPHRSRLEIKNKFKKEEKNNSWRIDKAFKEKRRLDLDFFKKLMEQILEDEEKKKSKNKELVKMAKSQRRVRRKGRVAKITETDTSEDSDSDVVAGEKENEDFSNDAGSDIIPKKHRGRGANTLGRGFKRTNGEDQPEECENGASDGQSQNDRLRESDSSENINKSPAIKPAQLKGRPQRLIPNLGRGWGNQRPQLKTDVQEGRTSARDDNSSKAPSASVQEKEKQQSVLLELEDVDEEPDLSAVQEQIFNKPTRSGRIPKLSQHVIQAAAEEEEDEEELSDLPTSSKVAPDIQAPRRRPKVKPGPRLKQGMQRRGKSRLVTLQASGTENDDDEEEEVEECVLSQEEFSPIPEEENQAFVPMSLRPLPPVSSEVVETMEELDISVNMPDILGTSQNALCPELACEQTPVPCEHQLDLLVDVIDFLDPDHMEVCREINNEAAQTLLTIGNSAQMMQTSEILCTSGSDVIEPSCIVHDEVIHEEIVTETAIMSAPSVCCDSEQSDFEHSKCETHIPEPSADETPTPKENTIKSQTTDAHPGPIQQDIQDSASVSAPLPKRGRFTKPKPNIGQSLRTRQAPQLKINSKGVTDSLETLKDPPSTEQDKNESQPMQEHSVPVDQPSDSSAIHSEVLQPDISSERREDSPRDTPKILAEEDKASVSSLNRNNENVITEEKIKEQEDARSEPQTNSMSDSQSASAEQSKPVRRPRGPRPKPNLTQTSRQMHTQTKHTMPSVTTVTPEKPSICAFTKSSEEGAVVNTESNVSQNTAQQEATSSIDLAQAVVSEDESTLKTVVTLNEDRTGPEEESNVKHSGCESKDITKEPVFILPPTLDEGAGFRIEPLPYLGVPELDSHGQSASESNNVSHLLITDALVPVSEIQEMKSGEDDVDESRKGQLKRKTQASTSQGNIEGEGQAEHDDLEVLESPVAEVTDDLEHLDQEHLEKKRKLPQRTRRAKLQVKPTPVSRRNTRPKEDTAGLSLKQTTSLPISTLQQTVPTTISASAPNSDSDNIHSPPQEKTPEESVQEGPSQGIMGQVDIPVKETELASGSASQGVGQTMPVATSGPLTRPGRRPKGFLSFISSKSTQGPAAAHRGAKPGPQKPAVNTARPERKPRAATEANPLEKRPTPTSASTNEQNSEDEPTSVSKYFFSDIFTEVDELEDMD